MKHRPALLLLCVLGSFGLLGCSGDASSNSENLSPVRVDGRDYLLDEEPDGAVGVIAARESVEDGTPLVLVGRIGGAANPWIEGRAAFTLVDPSITVVEPGTDSAADEICMEDCCAAERSTCTTLVKFVDENGRVVPVDSRTLLGLSESDMVVVKGTAKKDDNGNFSMLATGLFVRN